MNSAKAFFIFLADIHRSRRLLYELTKHDFVSRYLGSYLGIIWAVVQPIVTLCIFWFIFQVGFKARPVSNAPFIIWLMAGMVPWFFVSDSLSSATNSVIDKGYLVSKVVFRTSTLPIVKILSALIIHLFFILLLLVVLLVYGFKPDIYYIQIPYFLFASILFVLGISWATSALTVFLRDMTHLMNIVLQFLFWMTPIFWSLDMIPPRLRIFLKLNPLYYIVEGYRACLIHDQWFWQPYKTMAYFWFVTTLLFVGGAITFKRLRPHFADVL